MLMLSVDSSASPASVCLYEDGKILADYYLNSGFTHSQTLMAMVESVLNISGKTSKEIDVYAVNNGPGSFTGVRIGVSAVKGMAYAVNKPCVAVSTLESMAYNYIGQNVYVCSCMDARRNQVYNALFHVKNNTIERVCENRAIAVKDLLAELNGFDSDIVLVGDGAQLVFDSADDPQIHLAPPHLRFQRASAVAQSALEKYNRGETLAPAALMPSYLRLSQAERERNAKLSEKEG
ncbi:MAG: tRNA (adenosine(37)-N6)-threonylcarbamoyltransferase complex dimerization subunit type 1 TsaB [Ruminococcus sp.]|nr:tRNA (adenosine(37)-N6)-threonylcarbamoyltransferase complex dimerization subunit type 1 TsaB [Ruminococcus sp.]